jgi:hypothetical protein
MEVSGSIHAPATLPLAKEPAVSIEYNAEHFGEKKYLHSLSGLQPQFVGRAARDMWAFKRHIDCAFRIRRWVLGKAAVCR